MYANVEFTNFLCVGQYFQLQLILSNLRRLIHVYNLLPFDFSISLAKFVGRVLLHLSGLYVDIKATKSRRANLGHPIFIQFGL